MQTHPMTSVSDVSHYLNSWTPRIEDNIWKELIALIKKARDIDPYSPHSKLRQDPPVPPDYSLMWHEQCGINFPIMYVSCIYLYLYAKSKGCDTFLFATRDCCHWVRIFRKLFPHENIHYFNCSRNMFERGYTDHNPHFRKYVKSTIKTEVERAVYIDIHGTCQRVLTYFEKEWGSVPYCFLLSTSYRAYVQFPKICQKYHDLGKLLTVVFDARGTPIEMLNFDTMGTLQDYTAKGPQRDPPEYSVIWLEAYHTCIEYLLRHMKPWTAGTKDFQMEELDLLVKRIYRVIQDNKPVLNNYLKHPGKH